MKTKLLLTILFFCTLFSNAQNLIAHYPFDGNANDASGNGYNGTINGNTTLTNDRFMAENRAFTFPDQSSNITLANTTNTNLENGFTLNAWVKYKNNNITAVIVCKHVCGVPNGFAFGIDVDGQIQLWLANSSSTWSTVRTNTTFVENRWYMMTTCYDAVTGIAKIYINGEISGSGNVAYNYYSSNPISIGETYQNNCQPANLSGAIDEVKIYDRVLSETEIIQEYNLTRNSLVAYYPFNGNAKDESGNGYNGTVSGASLTTDLFNQSDKAYNFIWNGSSSDKIQIPGTSGLNFSVGGFSLSAWVKFSGASSGGYNYPIVSKHNCGEQSGYILMLYDDKITFWMAGAAGYSYLSTPESYTDDQWHQVTAVYDGANRYIYIDGQQKIYDAFAYTIPNTANWALGGYNGCNGGFNGKVDEVKVYNRRLTSAEIMQQYNTESTGLVAYYPFNGNANDASGNNNHGTLINNPTFTIDRFGNPDKAISFDKIVPQLVSIPDNPSIRIDTELTISVFVKRKNLVGNHNLVNKGGEYNSGSCNYDLSFSDASFVFKYNGSYHVGYVIHDMNWHHYAITTYDGSPDVKFYIDGVYSPSWVNGGTVNLKPTSHSDLQIGGTSYYSDNIMDDVRIYNRILSPTEIAHLFTNNDLKINNNENASTNNFYVSNNTLYFKNTQDLNSIKTAKVYNLLGQKVFDTSKIKAEIFLNYLTKGVYILKVENNDGKISSLKFLIE